MMAHALTLDIAGTLERCVGYSQATTEFRKAKSLYTHRCQPRHIFRNISVQEVSCEPEKSDKRYLLFIIGPNLTHTPFRLRWKCLGPSLCRRSTRKHSGVVDGFVRGSKARSLCSTATRAIPNRENVGESTQPFHYFISYSDVTHPSQGHSFSRKESLAFTSGRIPKSF